MLLQHLIAIHEGHVVELYRQLVEMRVDPRPSRLHVLSKLLDGLAIAAVRPTVLVLFWPAFLVCLPGIRHLVDVLVKQASPGA
jgi:hypothetical protein